MEYSELEAKRKKINIINTLLIASFFLLLLPISSYYAVQYKINSKVIRFGFLLLAFFYLPILRRRYLRFAENYTSFILNPSLRKITYTLRKIDNSYFTEKYIYDTDLLQKESKMNFFDTYNTVIEGTNTNFAYLETIRSKRLSLSLDERRFQGYFFEFDLKNDIGFELDIHPKFLKILVN